MAHVRTRVGYSGIIQAPFIRWNGIKIHILEAVALHLKNITQLCHVCHVDSQNNYPWDELTCRSRYSVYTEVPDSCDLDLDNVRLVKDYVLFSGLTVKRALDTRLLCRWWRVPAPGCMGHAALAQIFPALFYAHNAG